MTETEPQTLRFHVIEPRTRVPTGTTGWVAYLNRDQWDDWGKYCTQFYLTIVDPGGEQHGIGQVKIGQRGLRPHAGSADLPPGHRKPAIPDSFPHLEADFFSIGQEEDYYENLSALGDTVREHVLSCLHDVALDETRWDWAKEEEVMRESLLRSITWSTATGQFRRMAHGHARVTPYNFSYTPPRRLGGGEPPFTLEFSVDPESAIPTNVHVLIGRNGVGKTYLLGLMAKSLVARDAAARQSGRFELNPLGPYGGEFANVVSVSFSAFDEGDLLPDRNPEADALGFAHIGLRGWASDSPTAPIKPKTPAILTKEFFDSLKECRIGAKRNRWIEVLSTLETDPVFRAAQLTSLIEKDLSDEEEIEEVQKTFKGLSSGHKIVLLTLTRLVEKVEERTLVLIDEPEAHLHPPLLSAMTRAISDLMVKRNGVAVVATHSPVILQEVPRSCVWILDRLLTVSKAERPSIETFAESVGILSREVFKLELSKSGFHQVLAEICERFAAYEEALGQVEGQLGAEGKAVLRGMYLNREEQ